MRAMQNVKDHELDAVESAGSPKLPRLLGRSCPASRRIPPPPSKRAYEVTTLTSIELYAGTAQRRLHHDIFILTSCSCS